MWRDRNSGDRGGVSGRAIRQRCIPRRNHCTLLDEEIARPGPEPRRVVVPRQLPGYAVEIVARILPAFRDPKQLRLSSAADSRCRKLAGGNEDIVAIVARDPVEVSAAGIQVVQREDMV